MDRSGVKIIHSERLVADRRDRAPRGVRGSLSAPNASPPALDLPGARGAIADYRRSANTRVLVRRVRRHRLLCIPTRRSTKLIKINSTRYSRIRVRDRGIVLGRIAGVQGAAIVAFSRWVPVERFPGA